MNVRIDYLPFLNCPYRQKIDGYHFNSDTVLLGNFLEPQYHKSVLDIGTQAGALLMYAKSKGAQYLVGIDVFIDILALAQENIKEANFYCCQLSEFKHKEFDTIVVNPPFYPYCQRDNIYLETALNEKNLELEVLFLKARSLLKSNGSLFMIYPANRLNYLINKALLNDFSLQKGQFVYDNNKKGALRFLAKFKRGKNSLCLIEKPIYLDNGKILNI